MAVSNLLRLMMTALLLSIGCGQRIVRRADWGARQPRETTPLRSPVPLVFIHHTHTMGCANFSRCAPLVRAIQDFHMDANGWWDIGYNFLVGGEGLVFEGRGWHTVGAHTLGYNNRSVGISILGNYARTPPHHSDVAAVRLLIKNGVLQGLIHPDYQLFGHRQAQNDTSCPGDKLYSIIQKWPHYSTHIPPPYPTKI